MTRIYVALPDGLLVITGEPGRWQATRRMEELPAQCLAADPLRPERIYCGTFGNGLWRSDDAGETWRPAGAGIASPQVMAVAVSATERGSGNDGGVGVLYCGTEPTALYRSEDGGATWQECRALLELPSRSSWSFPPRPYTSHVRAIALDPNAPGRLYVAIEAGALVRSDDGGATWQDRQPGGPFDSHTLAMPRSAPGRLYSAAGDGFMSPGNGFARSDDGGATWRREGAGLREHYLWGLALDPADPEAQIVSAAPSPNAAHNPRAAESAIYRRTAGTDWQLCADGLPDRRGTVASVLAAHDTEPGIFYAANNVGIYRSPDAGLTWQRLDIPWPEAYHSMRTEGMVITEH